MKNKYIKIVAIVLLVLLFIVSIFYLSTSRKSSPSQSLSIQPQEIPSDISLDSTDKITINIVESEFDLPNSTNLLVISPQPPISEDRIKSIANNLDYNTEPIIVEDQTLGTIYVYNSETDGFSVNPQSNSVSFGSTQPLTAINKQLSDEELKIIGLDFLKNELEVDTNNLEFISFIYYQVPGTGEQRIDSSKSDADYFQLNYSPIINDLVILTLNPDLTPYYVQILPDGRVHKAGTQEIGNLIQSGDNFKLKNLAEINNSLDQTKIVSLDNGNLNLIDINSQFIESISINTIELAYLYISPENKTLQPIYILKGEAELLSPNRTVEVVLYMPAISQS